MEDRDLDALLREALAADATPSERVWRASRRKREPRWLPSFGEIGWAVAVGVLTLAFLVTQTAPHEAKPSLRIVDRQSSFDRLYVASTKMATKIP